MVPASFPCANYYLCVGRDPRSMERSPVFMRTWAGVHPGEEPAKRVELWTTRDVEPGKAHRVVAENLVRARGTISCCGCGGERRAWVP